METESQSQAVGIIVVTPSSSPLPTPNQSPDLQKGKEPKNSQTSNAVGQGRSFFQILNPKHQGNSPIVQSWRCVHILNNNYHIYRFKCAKVGN